MTTERDQVGQFAQKGGKKDTTKVHTFEWTDPEDGHTYCKTTVTKTSANGNIVHTRESTHRLLSPVENLLYGIGFGLAIIVTFAYMVT